MHKKNGHGMLAQITLKIVFEMLKRKYSMERKPISFHNPAFSSLDK